MVGIATLPSALTCGRRPNTRLIDPGTRRTEDMIVIAGNWKTIALQGVVALLFGILALAWPGLTVRALVLLFGAYAIVDGAFALAAAITNAPDARDHRTTFALWGVISVAAGLVAFVWPGITALALLYVIAAWALLTGAVRIALAVQLRRVIEHEWLMVLSGVLSIAFATLLVITPGAGALAITWLIGWFALLFGSMLFALAWRLHKLESALQSELGRPRHGARPAQA
jgi:uncharacterized membrane protein HdeD (DUF308 family)